MVATSTQLLPAERTPTGPPVVLSDLVGFPAATDPQAPTPVPTPVPPSSTGPTPAEIDWASQFCKASQTFKDAVVTGRRAPSTSARFSVIEAQTVQFLLRSEAAESTLLRSWTSLTPPESALFYASQSIAAVKDLQTTTKNIQTQFNRAKRTEDVLTFQSALQLALSNFAIATTIPVFDSWAVALNSVSKCGLAGKA
jgi:hypothetical protein